MSEIFISSDHRGFNLKNHLVTALSASGEVTMPEGYQVTDLGPFELDPGDDFNDAAISIAQAVKSHPGSFGILICGSAHGISIQANRFKGIRAIAAYNEDLARLGREHNDANILCLSADFTDDQAANRIVETFLNTNFLAEERFIRRNNRLDELILGDNQ